MDNYEFTSLENPEPFRVIKVPPYGEPLVGEIESIVNSVSRPISSAKNTHYPYILCKIIGNYLDPASLITLPFNFSISHYKE